MCACGHHYYHHADAQQHLGGMDDVNVGHLLPRVEDIKKDTNQTAGKAGININAKSWKDMLTQMGTQLKSSAEKQVETSPTLKKKRKWYWPF